MFGMMIPILKVWWLKTTSQILYMIYIYISIHMTETENINRSMDSIGMLPIGLDTGIRAHGQNNWRLNPDPVGLNPFEFLDDPDDPDDHSPQKPSFDSRKTIF
jgi:hypothetical protein